MAQRRAVAGIGFESHKGRFVALRVPATTRIVRDIQASGHERLHVVREFGFKVLASAMDADLLTDD